MAGLFLSAVMLSIGYCATPRMVTAEALRRGLRGGFRPALAFQCGASIGGDLWAALGLLGGGAVAQYPMLRFGLGLLGLGVIGRTVWRVVVVDTPAVCRPPGQTPTNRISSPAS